MASEAARKEPDQAPPAPRRMAMGASAADTRSALEASSSAASPVTVTQSPPRARTADVSPSTNTRSPRGARTVARSDVQRGGVTGSRR